MGRAAVHSEKIITWEEAMASNFQFCPNVASLTNDSPAPVQADKQGRYPVPTPGAWSEICQKSAAARFSPGSVVKFAGNDDDRLGRDVVNESMLVVDAPRPAACQVVFEGFGFAQSTEWIPCRVQDQGGDFPL
jgi:hypothetical protein